MLAKQQRGEGRFSCVFGLVCLAVTLCRAYSESGQGHTFVSAMGNRRAALLGLAMIVLLVVDTAAGSSKGASRPGSHRRSAAKAAGSTSRSSRSREEERDFGDHLSMKDGVGKGAKRPKSKSGKEARNHGSVRSRSRPSSASSSRSSSRYVVARNQHGTVQRFRSAILSPRRRAVVQLQCP